MDIQNAILALNRLQFPFQKGETFLRFSEQLQKELLAIEDLDRSFFIMFKPIFLKLNQNQKTLLAKNQSCDPEILLMILNDGVSLENREIKIALAKNTNLPLKAQKLLSLDSDEEVRFSLAHNKNVSEDILRETRKPIGYLEIDLHIAGEISKLSHDEILKTQTESIENKKIQFFEAYRRPNYGNVTYVIDHTGRLHLLVMNADTSG